VPEDIPILPISCLILPQAGEEARSSATLSLEEPVIAAKQGHSFQVDKGLERRETLRREVARTIAHWIGKQERMATPIPGLRLAQRTSPSAPCPVTYGPSVVVVAQGRKRVELGANSYFYDDSRFLLTSLELPALASVLEASEAAPCLALMIDIEMSTVRELLAQDEAGATEDSGETPAMTVGEATTEFLDACCRLLRLLSSPEDIPVLGALFQREILYRVLRSSAGARLRAIATQGEQSHRVAKSIAWIRANFRQPLRMEELAQVAGMGVSTLHHHFRALTAMSPLQYQKQVRLQMARSRMLMDGVDANAAAYEVGYESASQFSREYSRFFGQPPLRDVRTLRESMTQRGTA
jgi:AraC-like DNA-binding protein